MSAHIPNRKINDTAHKKRIAVVGTKADAAMSGTGSVGIHYAKQ